MSYCTYILINANLDYLVVHQNHRFKRISRFDGKLAVSSSKRFCQGVADSSLTTHISLIFRDLSTCGKR